jgi:hypothetical protein
VRRTTQVAVLLVAVFAVLAPSARAATPDSASVRARIRISDVGVHERSDGVTRVVFIVTLSRPTQASVRFKTVDGTATAGLDYTAANGTLRFTPSRTSKKVKVEVVGDQLIEEEETFGV